MHNIDQSLELKLNGTRRRGMGSHESTAMINDEWLTPQYIIDAIGPFDLDPCAPIIRPWPTAEKHYTRDDDGLIQEWYGRVWCNPPYGPETGQWLRKLADHGNGIALVFARTETDFFFRQIWDRAHSVFFFKGRLYFYNVNGRKSSKNAGAPSCLVAYGINNTDAIEEARTHNTIIGKHILLQDINYL